MNHEEELARIEEEQSIIAEERSILQERQDLTQPTEFAPSANRKKVNPLEANVSPEDIEQLQSVGQRELNQLQGQPQRASGVSDFIAQTASSAMNPVRELFGMEPRQAGTYINPVEQWQSNETERRLSLAKRGIGSGEASLFSRFKESLAMNDDERIKTVKKSLDEQFKGQDVKVGIDKDTNEPVYVNPNDNKMYTINPIGFEMGDVVAYTGDAILGIGEGVATVIGATMKSKNKLSRFVFGKEKGGAKKEVAYGAAGVAVADAIKISLGKVFGVNDDVTIGEIALDAGKEASISLGVGVGFEGIKKTIKKIRNIRGDIAIPAHLLDKLKEGTDKITNTQYDEGLGGQLIIDEVNKILRAAQSDNVLNPNIAKVLGDSETLDIVESLKRGGGAQEKTALLGREASDLEAQKDFLNIIGKDVTETQPVGKSDLANQIQDVNQPQLLRARQAAEQPLNQAANRSEEFLGGMPTITSYDAGVAVKKDLFEEAQKFKDVAQIEYTKLGQLMDESLIEPSTFKMQLELSALDDIDPAVKTGRIADEFDADSLDITKDWSLSKINKAIKRIGEKIDAYGTMPTTATIGKLKKAHTILKNAEQQALKGDPGLLEKVNALRAAYGEGKEIFNKNIANSILNIKGEMAQSEIFKTVIKDSKSSSLIASAILDKPQAMTAMRSGINDLYKFTVAKDGIIDLGAHQKFIRDYVDTRIITPFYTEKQIKNLRNADSISKMYKQEKIKTENLMKKIDDTFGGSISGLDGTTLFNRFWGQEKQNDIKRLKILLKDNPEVFKRFQAEVLSDIEKKVISKGTFSTSSLETLLKKNDGSIKEILGEGYFKNLTLLNDSLKITGRKGTAKEFDQKSSAAQIAKLYFGQLNPINLRITAADRLRSSYARKLLTEMVLDPEKLKKFSALRRARSGSDTANLILTRLGYSILADDKEQGFRSKLQEVGKTVGLVYKEQKKENLKRQRSQELKDKKEKEDRIKYLQTRNKTLSQL